MKTYHRLLVSGFFATATLFVSEGANAQASAPAPAQAPEPSPSGVTDTSTAQAAGNPNLKSEPVSVAAVGGTDSRYSLMPYTTNGYVGANIGGSRYDFDCGSTGSCDKTKYSGKIYAGGFVNPYLGFEFGYLHMGRAERGGGRTRAHGLNFSVVGNMPVGDNDFFAVFAKAGVTYGRTRTTVSEGSDVASGNKSDFGPSFGVGASMNLANNWAAVVEWERHRFEFAGGKRDWVDQATVGVKYRF